MADEPALREAQREYLDFLDDEVGYGAKGGQKDLDCPMVKGAGWKQKQP